jgi:hypothetical protein
LSTSARIGATPNMTAKATPQRTRKQTEETVITKKSQ